MGVYEGRGTLGKAIKQLESRWMEARMSWDDIRSREFEERFLMPIKSDLMMAVSAMDQMAVLINRIHQECE